MVIRLTFVAILALLALPAQAQNENTISVTGIGSVEAPPDMAEIRVGVDTNARAARDALMANSQAMAALFAVLSEAGVEAADMQTTTLSLHPRYERRNNSGSVTVTGYAASNGLFVRVRDIEATGLILDRLSEAGANVIQSVTFSIADPAPLEEAARRGAVANARAKAELYAEEAGITLGRVLSLSEQGIRRPQPQMMEMARAQSFEGAPPPVAGGELSITASISAVFEIAE